MARPTARASLFYLAGYLLLTGVALLFVPQPALRLLGATGSYESPFVQFTGAFMIALGSVVTQIIRHRVEVLYPTTVAVRLFFLAVIVWLYVATRDPLWLVILGVVALGVMLTTTGLLIDRRAGTGVTGTAEVPRNVRPGR
jgi:hypothetical protein